MSQNMILMCCKRSCELYKKGTIKNAYASESIDSSKMSRNALSRSYGNGAAPCCLVILSQRLSNVDKTVICATMPIAGRIESHVMSTLYILCVLSISSTQAWPVRAVSVYTVDLVCFKHFQHAGVNRTHTNCGSRVFLSIFSTHVLSARGMSVYKVDLCMV